MRRARVFVNGVLAGELLESERGSSYVFRYDPSYRGVPVSLTLPVQKEDIRFSRFPPFFEGLLPEGVMLEGLLRQNKIDSDDLLAQLLAVGGDLVGAVTVKEAS